MLYLMIVVRFRVWLDAARVSIYLSLVTGGAVLFISGHARLPCSDSGIEHMCSQLTLSVVIASCAISGLMLFYSIVLWIVACIVPRPLLAKAPDDIMEEGLHTVNSRSSLIPTTEKSRPQASLSTDRGYGNSQFGRPVQGLARQHAPQPLNLTEGAALRPAFSYTVTASPAPTSSLSTPMSSEMRYTTPLITHPYANADSTPASPWFDSYRRGLSPTSVPSAVSSTHDSSRIPYPALRPSRPLPSVESSGTAAAQINLPPTSIARSATAHSAPPYLAVPSQALASRPFPNPFMDPISRSTTPGTPSTISSGAQVPIKSQSVSLSFGSRGFPLPPSYNVTPWSAESNSSASSTASQTPPGTPLSLRPGVRSTKQSWPSVTDSPRPLSFGSIAASFHSTGTVIPSPPAPAAHLPPHPRLQTHLESTPSPGALYGEPGIASPLRAVTTPMSAKTFRSQFLPTDIPDWLASEHKNDVQ